MGIPYQAGCSFFIKYFDKRLALANNINSVATGMGYVVLPSMLEATITTYGWRGALLIIAAVMGNICVCATLLHTLNLKEDEYQAITEKHEHRTEQPGLLQEVAKSFDLSLFRNIRYIFQGIINGLLVAGLYLVVLYMVPHAVTIGIPELKASYLMTGFGVGSFASRLFPIGVLIDKNIISPSTLGGAALLACAANIFIMAFSKTYVWLLVLAVISGVTVGMWTTLLHLVVIRSAGSKEKAPGALAWLYLSEGVGSLPAILLSGKVV